MNGKRTKTTPHPFADEAAKELRRSAPPRDLFLEKRFID
jgi:hypothetical protein